MKKFCALSGIFLLWPLCVSALPSGGTAYSFTASKTITIDHTKVGTVNNTDQTNFPVLIYGTYTYLKTVANGGSIQNTTTLNNQTAPADLIYTSDSGCQNRLSWEVASYTAATGAIEIWVKIPTVSHTADTLFYECYGNGNIAQYQGNPTNVWDANYRTVNHLANGSALSTADSTSNAFTLTNTASVGATTGQIDGGASFNGSNQDLRSTANAYLAADATPYTISAWVNAASTSASDHNIIGYGLPTFSGASIQFSRVGSNWQLAQWGSAGYATAVMTGGVSVGTWQHAVGTWDGTNIRLYIGGTIQATTAKGDRQRNGTYTSWGSDLPDVSGGQFWDGSMDELRISNIARSADWIITEFNNQNSPSTFYAVTP